MAAMTLLAAFAAWKSGVDLAFVADNWKKFQELLRQNPWVLFSALVILPGLPVPTSALLIIAGLVWGDQPVSACLYCLVALILNLTWTYWLAAGPAREVVGRMLSLLGITVPEVPAGDHLKLILILKLTPGIPLFFQNYMLGFLRAPFRLYLPVSILCNGIIGTGIVLSSVGIGGKTMMPALSGISLVVVGVVIVRTLRKKLGRRGSSPSI